MLLRLMEQLKGLVTTVELGGNWMVMESHLEMVSARTNEKSITTSVLMTNALGVLIVKLTDLAVSPLIVAALLSIM